MNDRIERMVARFSAANDKAGKALWYMVTIGTVLDLLTLNGSVTRDELRKELEKRRDIFKSHKLVVEAYDEAIDRLDNWQVDADD